MLWLFYWGQLLLALAAFALAWVGLRGRAVGDDHPRCGQCGYDLFGLAAGSPVCPECGASLRRRGAIRVGGRPTRRWGAVAAAMVCAALAYGLGPLRTILWREWVAAPAAFVRAVRAGDEKAVADLLNSRPGLIKLSTPGQTLLDMAVAAGEREEVVKQLLAAGADPNEVGSGAGYRPLHRAAWEDKPGVVQVLLAGGADPNVKDARGETPLHFAARRRGPGTVPRILLAKGADPNARDLHASTPLHSAAATGKAVEVVQALLDGKADVNAADDQGRTPLHLAAAGQNWDVALALVKADAKLAAVDGAGKVPGRLAREADPRRGGQFVARLYQQAIKVRALTGKLDDVREALRGDPGALSESGPDGTLLHVAAALRESDLVKALLDCGADANARDGDGRTALHRAAWGHDPATAGLLVAGGADVNARDKHGLTPLHVAADSPARARTIDLLVSHGADVRAKDEDGMTPLEYAAASTLDDRDKVLEAMLGRGEPIDIYAAAALGREQDVRRLVKEDAALANGGAGLHRVSPLEVAAWHGRLGAARALIDAGAVLDGGALAGPPWPSRTPLMDAIGRKHLDVAALLLDHGARLDLPNSGGATPLHVAAIAGEDAVRLLLGRGAETNVTDPFGLTPLHLAAGYSDVPAVRLLVEAGADVTARDVAGLSALDHANRGNRRRPQVAKYLESVMPVPPEVPATGPTTGPATRAATRPATAPSPG